MLDLFQGDTTKLVTLDQKVAEELGFEKSFDSVGQVYRDLWISKWSLF